MGFFKDEGLDVEISVLKDAPALIAAVATDQIDVAGVSITPGLYAAVDQDINIRLVGDKQSVRPGFSGTRMVVRKDLWQGTPEATIQSLRGKTLAVSSRGAMVYYLMAKILQNHGIDLKDVNVVEMSYANTVAAMQSGSIDGGMLLDPFLTQSLRTGVAMELSDSAEAIPGGEATIVGLVYSEKFRNDRPMGEAFMRAYMKGVRAYNDAYIKNLRKDEVVDIITSHTKMDRDIVANSFPVGLDPDQKINVPALEEFQKFFAEQGLLRTPIDVNRIIDASFSDAARKTLGDYSYE
jgi:NitT/TauT family transport system substrate-binding protein